MPKWNRYICVSQSVQRPSFMLASSGVNDSPQSEEHHRPQGGWACSTALWDSFCKDKKSTTCLILFDGA